MAQGGDGIVALLSQTLEPNNDVRKNAEKQLDEVKRKPGFAISLLQLMEGGTPSPVIEQVAAVQFKNVVREFWNEVDSPVLSATDRDNIKRHILNLMVKVTPRTRASLSEAVRIIGVSDFPEHWPYLLPDLTKQLANSQDFSVIIGLLETANTLFKIFRNSMGNDDIRLKLKFCLENFAAPLLEFFKRCFGMIESLQGNIEGLRNVFSALRLLTRIFYSLNVIDLPEFFEDHIEEWMTMFLKLLQYENKALDSDDDEKPGPVEQVHAAVIINATLYLKKYEEEFQPFIEKFTEATWALLIKTPPQQRYDALMVEALKFLSTLVANIRLTNLFRPVLGDLVSKVIVPNIQLRESDIELFEDNPLEFIRSDIEGSNQETRRRGSCDLVRAMCRHFEAETTAACNQLLGTMISEKRLDSAVTLLIAVGVKSYTPLNGATELNGGVQIEAFFQQFIVPAMTSQDVNADPIEKSAVIKFFSTFRKQMPRDVVLQMLPHLARLLQAKSFVVHSYAASCIERIFMIRKNNDPRVKPVEFVYGPAELQPVFEPILVNLFALLEQGSANEYVAKAVMRVLSKAEATVVAKIAPTVLPKLCAVMQHTAQNPQNPRYIHQIFESLSILVRNSCRVDPSLADPFEAGLMPVFTFVLSNQVSELTSYVYQMLALLLELRPTGPSAGYLDLFPRLLTPVLWENRGDVPGLVRLLQAFLQRAAAETVGADKTSLQGLLGVFQFLLASKSTSDLSMVLITCLVEFLPVEAYREFLPDILKYTLTRAQKLKSKVFGQSVSLFLSVLVGKHGAIAVKDTLEAISPGLFAQVVLEIWCVSAEGFKKAEDRKSCSVGLVRILSEVPEMQRTPDPLQKILVALLSTFTTATTVEVKSPEELLAELEEGGYNSSYTRLVYAQNEVRDSFPEVPNARIFVAKFLAEASAKQPGVFPGLLANQSDQIKQMAMAICQEAGVSIV
mmetsp:Transcript_6873/g.12139  ORF Transcript_6873/g.12139 Transcript_6873/m.12139 type:complete len:959 (+) Transcript_6873:172-3048(+)